MIIQNGTKFRVTSDADAPGVQLTAGKDASRFPFCVFADDDDKRAIPVRIVTSGDPTRFPIVQVSGIPSTNLAAWFRADTGVTGTLTASNWADQSGNGRDLAQGTAGNQPIYLPYAGTAYAWLPGVSGNYFTTPDAAANSVFGSGSFDLRVRCALNDVTPAATNTLIAKWPGAGTRAYLFVLDATNTLRLAISNDGTTVNVNVVSANTGATDATDIIFRVTYVFATGAYAFYKSTDGDSWTSISSGTTAAATPFDGAGSVEVGAHDVGTSEFTLGKLYRAQIYNGINGTLAVDFNPSTFAETSTNGATAVASTGETWTLNSTGAKPAQIVKSPQIMFDGVNDFLVTSTFNLSQPITIYAVWKQNVWDSTDTIYECSTNSAWYNRITQNGSTPDLKFSADSGGTKISAANANAALGAKVITTTIGNGASGLFQINNTTALTGDYGTFGTTGLQIAADSAGGARWSAITFWEFIMFNAAHTAAQRASVQQYLAARHGIALA